MNARSAYRAPRSATLRSPNVRGAWSPNGARDGIPLFGSLKGKYVATNRFCQK
jgi:hypothetical protein